MSGKGENDEPRKGMVVEEAQSDYEVGYKKPPRHTQFKPGVSGNPRGRKKGSRSLGTILRGVMGERIPVRLDGKLRKVPYLEALVRKMAGQAAQGDAKAAALLVTLIRVAGMLDPEPDHGGQAEAAKLAEEDRQLMAQLLGRNR